MTGDSDLTAASIWKAEVPPRGQAATVRGELLRAIEKLRDEAQRNGNVNWSHQHTMLIAFLREHLVPVVPAVAADLERLTHADTPATDDDIYDRLVSAMLAWAAREPAPEPLRPNPDLRV